MATHAQAYRDSDAQTSGNLSPFQLKQLVKYSALPETARQTILAALEISNGAGILLWSSVKSLSIETRRSPRTIQYRRRRMRLALGIVRVTRHANTWAPCGKCGAEDSVRQSRKCAACGHEGDAREFRRSATYELDVAKIASFKPPVEVREFRNYREYKSATAKKRPHSHSSPAPRPATPAVHAPQPVPISQPQARCTSAKEPNRRERDEMAKFVAKTRELMRGATSVLESVGGLRIQLSPNDPRYRAPMPLERAITAACMTQVVPEKKAREWLKLLPRSLEESP